VQAQFSKSGKKIQPQALNQFIEITGHDSALLSGEIEKLIVFTSGVPVITLEHVEKITSGDKQTIFWKLRDAVGKRSLPQALEVLDQLLEQQESPIQLLASLVHTVSDLLSVRRLVESGILSESFAGRRYWEIEKAWKEHLAEAKTRAEQESEKAFLSKHPFVVFQAIQSAQYFSRQDLREGLNALSRADELLKSTPLKPHWILEPLLFQMLSKDRIKNS
jgi:DNA polymerase-3 subunit delta